MRKLLTLLTILVLSSVLAIAQTKEVTGTVTDASGSPIPGVSIKVKGAKAGTSTNTNGAFKLKLPLNARLTISAVGYETKEISVGELSSINIQLNQDTRALSEVVVTGVGVATSKKKVPIDVATLSSKDFPKSATTSVEQTLVGQIAGAQIQETTGQPGNGALIILRGLTNLGSSQPLIMIDGVQTTSDLLTNLDPANIDRIEVVKGAAGGMLYGSQGGNGVIQVFTKKGSRNNKMSITLNSKISVDNVLRVKRPLLADYHHYDTDASGNILDVNGVPIAQDAVGAWSDPSEENYTQDPTVVNNKPFKLPVYDHISQGYRTANTASNSLNIRGGNTNSDYSFTFSRLDQQDVFSNKYNRNNLALI